MERKTKLVFNNKAMVIYFILCFISITLAVVDTSNITIFITTKTLALIILIILLVLSRFIPKKYLED